MIPFYILISLQYSGVPKTEIEENIVDLPPIVGTPRVLQVEEKEVSKRISISDSDYEWLLKVVAAESLNQGYTGQRMVAGVIIGRMLDTTGDFRNQNTIEEVVTAKHQFACVTDGGIYRHHPNEETIKACNDELEDPQYTYLRFFRTGHYGYGQPVMKYKDHYFSK